jgi:hypothetical protein
MRSRLLLILLGAGPLLGEIGVAQERQVAAKLKETVSCDEFATTTMQQVMGKTVGVEQCQIVSEETVFNIKGQKFRRVEMRLTGAVDGWASTEKGSRAIYFTDGPDFVFTQSGLTGPRARGIARYEASTGHGMTIIHPEDPRHWNGKLFMTAHGAGSYGAIGALMPRDPNAKFNALQNVNRYVTLMIDKGYAVAHTMRSSDRTRGDVSVTLEDGTTLKNNLSSHAGLMTSWTALTQNFVSKRIGSKAARVYFYGHSAGGFLGRLINYQPGANVDPNGKPIFSGFLIDDAGSGLWLPKLIVDNKDVLFTTDQDRHRFVKQIDVTHLLYVGETGDSVQNKRENARLLLEKGLGAKHRHYEIDGVSHFDAGQVSRRDSVFQTLDLTGIFDALIDRLDTWVEKDMAPPANKANIAELRGPNKNNDSRNAAVALPEVACPLGIYYIFPPTLDPGRRGGQETAFAPFDGVNLEPLDGRGIFVDMNANGIRDKRETVSQAWQRLGLVKPGQKLTQAIYTNCVNTAASKLVQEGLLPKKVGEFYVEQAKVRFPGHVPIN